MGHLLAKQHLASGSDGPLLQLVEDLVGLHGTSPTAPYLSLHARLRGFSKADLDRELYERRSLVRMKTMRGTVFVLSHGLAAIAHAAMRRTIVARDRRYLGLVQADYDTVAPLVLRALEGRALSISELRSVLNTDADLSAVIGILSDEGGVVRDRPTGSWRSTTFRYRRWDDVLPTVDLTALSEEDAVRLLIQHYVAAYGPVTLGDIEWWTGLSLRLIRRAIDQLGQQLVDVHVTDLPGSFLVTTEGLAELERDAPTDRSVALLPGLDPFTMGYRERDRYLDPGYRDLVFDRGGNATSTILVGGDVAGVWDVADEPSPAVRVLLFNEHHRHRETVLERAAAVGQFWFGVSVPVIEYSGMVPLSMRSGVMRKPLDGATLVGPSQ